MNMIPVENSAEKANMATVKVRKCAAASEAIPVIIVRKGVKLDKALKVFGVEMMKTSALVGQT